MRRRALVERARRFEVESRQPMSSRAYRLSKSRFTAGVQCHRQLWWRVHEPHAPELRPDADLQAVFDMGNQVPEHSNYKRPSSFAPNAT
jgi:hypothetical protein